MSTDDHDDNAQRKHEVKSYLRGEIPPPPELARAPLLENWRAVITQFRDAGDPLRMVLVLTGRVVGHPRLPDERTIRTSQLIWLDRQRKWARTWTWVYRLGAPAGDGTDPEESEE